MYYVCINIFNVYIYISLHVCMFVYINFICMYVYIYYMYVFKYILYVCMNI